MSASLNERLRNVASALGIDVDPAATIGELRALIGHRAPPVKRTAPPAVDKVHDEDVFRLNEKMVNKCNDKEIDARWDFLKSVVLQPNDMAVPKDLVAEMKPPWVPVLKEKDMWHFRKMDNAPKAEDASPAAKRAKLREEQEAEYAIAQVADYEKDAKAEQAKLGEKHHETKQKTEASSAVAMFERRLVDAIMLHPGVSVQMAHAFSRRVFTESSPVSYTHNRAPETNVRISYAGVGV